MSPATKVVVRLPKPKIRKKELLKRTRKTRQQRYGGRHARPKQSPGPRTMMLCPNCGSSNLSWTSGVEQLWSIWECRSCGFRGAFISRSQGPMRTVREGQVKRTLKH